MKTVIKLLSTSTLLASAILCGCSNDGIDAGNETNPVEIPAAVSSGTNDFAFKFFKTLQDERPQEDNLFVSPLGLHMALGMLLNGAEGETAGEIQKTLEMNGVSDTDLNNAYTTLMNDLPKVDPKVNLGLANSMWYRSGFQVETNFMNVLRETFDADITGLPFDATAIKKINQWASDKTNGKIPEVLQEIGGDQIMFLINALYFKGDWQTQFNKADTRDTPFTIASGAVKTVKMMHTSSDFLIGSGENYRALQLPYANGQYNLTLLLPTQGKSISEVMHTMNRQEWSDLQTTKLRKGGVKVGLPRFKLTGNQVLNSTLDAMGMKRAFSAGEAELGKISKSAKLFVGFVKQDSYLGVDEKGTEAAAVTVISIELTSAGPGTTQEFICNEPFGMIISEKTSNTILFMGRIMNPDSE